MAADPKDAAMVKQNEEIERLKKLLKGSVSKELTISVLEGAEAELERAGHAVQDVAEEITKSLGSVRRLLKRFEDSRPDAAHSKSLQEMITTGHFSYVNVNITEANFPDIGVKTDPPSGEAGFKVYYPNKTVSSDQMIAEMAKEGYRPANLRELLNWMKANWNGKDWVVALGQEWRFSDGSRRVPCLYFDGGRKLDLDWCGGGWFAGCRFLAVRNS